jgi:hypothetical protein
MRGQREEREPVLGFMLAGREVLVGTGPIAPFDSAWSEREGVLLLGEHLGPEAMARTMVEWVRAQVAELGRVAPARRRLLAVPTLPSPRPASGPATAERDEVAS